MDQNFDISRATIIDVRENYECATEMAENAVNIPLNKVIHMVDELNAMPKPILMYCQSGNRSGQASMVLKARGVNDVFNAGSLYDVKSLQSNDLV